MSDKIDLNPKQQNQQNEETDLSALSNPDHITADLMSSGIQTTAETETLKQKFVTEDEININERLNSTPQLEVDVEQVQNQGQDPHHEHQPRQLQEQHQEDPQKQNQDLSQNLSQNLNLKVNLKQTINKGPQGKSKDSPAKLGVPTTPYPPTIVDRFMNFLAYLLKKLEILLVGLLKQKEPEQVIFHKLNEVFDLKTKKKKKKRKKDHDQML